MTCVCVCVCVCLFFSFFFFSCFLFLFPFAFYLPEPLHCIRAVDELPVCCLRALTPYSSGTRRATQTFSLNISVYTYFSIFQFIYISATFSLYITKHQTHPFSPQVKPLGDNGCGVWLKPSSTHDKSLVARYLLGKTTTNSGS